MYAISPYLYAKYCKCDMLLLTYNSLIIMGILVKLKNGLGIHRSTTVIIQNPDRSDYNTTVQERDSVYFLEMSNARYVANDSGDSEDMTQQT